MLRAGKLYTSRCARSRLLWARKFSLSALAREVQLFDMPSMSPTMEEGGIIEWKVKQGEAFNAGDVLLEIETDKAEIAVEAGDDGILAKILVEAGEKGIKVGRPIAVTAEEGDDLASIDYDKILSSSGPTKKDVESKSTGQAPEQESAAPKSNTTPPPNLDNVSSNVSETASEGSTSHANASHGNHGTEPLPAALRLIHEHHLSVNEIKGSGPYGRITKGDVLAYLGQISKDYPIKEQNRIEKREKLDLSKVEVAPPKKPEEKAGSSAQPAQPEKPKPLVHSVSIPLTAFNAAKVGAAQRTALRQALLSLQPKPSVLRDSVLDALTTSSRPPFTIKSSKVQVFRAKPVSLDVILEEPPAAKPSKAVLTYIEVLKAELSPEAN